MALEDEDDPGGPVFFLSYAHAQSIKSQVGPRDANRFVVRLFDDLSEHVAELVASPTGVDPGFMDRLMEDGTRWTPELLAAVGTCRVFVPLISSRYVRRIWCAKEWDAFSRRKVLSRAPDSSGSRTAILPVRWSPTREDKLPRAVRELQFFQPQRLTSLDIAQLYRDEGVYGLLAVKDNATYQEAYQAVVWRLAGKIVDVYHAYRVESNIPAGPGELRDSFRGDDE